MKATWWRYVRALALPVLLWGLVLLTLREPIQAWLVGSEVYDRAVLREWLVEARGNLPVQVENYLPLARRTLELQTRNKNLQEQFHQADSDGRAQLALLLSEARDQLFKALAEAETERARIEEQLRVLAVPPTREYPDGLPLFAKIQRIEILFDVPGIEPIVWDSHDEAGPRQSEEMTHPLAPHVWVRLLYQIHAYDKRQREEQARAERARRLGALAAVVTLFALGWVGWAQRRERERQRQQSEAQAQLDQAERARLEEELRRKEAEQKQEEAERGLLQQRLAAQEYERKMLQLRSELYASIGIMAGSYAHNIKNLLVRPNDLIRRCLESASVDPAQARMLQEVRQTLGTVTERLQQILATVRRDPTRSQKATVDLALILRQTLATWQDLARDKWKMNLTLELSGEPLWIEGDFSHLQQTVENLLFNARDATFEMRNHLRDQARQTLTSEAGRRQALIAAAAWRGQVEMRAWRQGQEVIMQMRDNGIGMTEEVRQRCTETHFSTKRNDASYEGFGTGMGLGLSFVQMVLEHHQARLEIESEPLAGASFRLYFPAIPGPVADNGPAVVRKGEEP